MIRCYAMVFCIFAAGCAGPEVRIAKLAGGVIESAQKRNPALDEIAALSTGLREHDLSEKKLENYSNKTVNNLYNALTTITFYFSEQDRYVAMQERVLEEKFRRSAHTDYDIKRMCRTYFGARMFKKAASLKKQFPNIIGQVVPEIITSLNPSNPSRWRVYDMSDGGKKAEIKTLPMEEGPKIVMIILTGCSVAEQAMTQILADAELAGVFKKYGILLTARFDGQGIVMWKDHFNFREIYIVDKASDFPGFNFRSSPNFYFLKDGKIISQIDGWNKESKAKLHKAVKYILTSAPKPSQH